MRTETQIQIFSLSAVLLFGAFLGGFVTFQMMEEKFEQLESQQQELPEGFDGQDLTQIFSSLENSTVSIDAIGGERGQGSGFIYSEDGYIVTNNHVVQDADRIRVTLPDGSTTNAEVAGSDVYTDLAVLEVDRDGFEPVELADSRGSQVGERVVAVGNPFGFRTSMTYGIISQKERLLPTGGGFSTPDIIQTDAAINPGNSGGPLVDMRGEVIGVNTAIETQTGVFSGIGFAIPSNTVERVIPELIEEGDYSHSWIGISGVDMNSDIAEAMDLDRETGFLVVEVQEGGPADLAGIRAGEEEEEIAGEPVITGGDVIIGIDDREVRDISDILVYLAQETRPGDNVELEFLREGEEMSREIELQSRRDRQG